MNTNEVDYSTLPRDTEHLEEWSRATLKAWEIEGSNDLQTIYAHLERSYAQTVRNEDRRLVSSVNEAHRFQVS